ncbi:MAG: cytochrome c-550 PedF [Magnetovibrionaceae bacterium]
MISKPTRYMFAAALATALGAGLTLAGSTGPAIAHGDVTPQAVDTTGLPELGEEWVDTNPFREDDALKPKAIEIGSSAYNQNCARCHGLEVISGGIAPDLRYLEEDFDGDEWFIERVSNGAVRDGKVYMPAFEGVINQEGLWAIRTYIDSRPED